SMLVRPRRAARPAHVDQFSRSGPAAARCLAGRSRRIDDSACRARRGSRGMRDSLPRSGPIEHRRVGQMTDEALGPISYLVVEFPGNKMTGEGFPVLVDLVDRGLIRILDLVFVTLAADGSIRNIELSDLDRGQMDLSVFEGASSGLLDDSDLADAAAVIDPGSSAAILIFENRWATPFTQALRRGGAELVAAGYVPQDALLASLDATDK